ncbi:hypothetical protein M2475_000144 [Breznakia sp. PF5-3]|uniref:DUF3788 domain-containing protein n=1 Tax=unclassified Breznakia TaxID=2623764 RepID=UPI0024075AD8|nr:MULTISPECIES: DUF3788 domain-containing protein [unclassified Breznakia]MDF9823839.1 hypothetical protein [Breznakia sp. PM6-1]MDF9834595.1 hypothetical protein [Breznakia sp. PF5-3]MDF9836788.1 hypothetical protein [Breznakia sp. PFB2-8]MDF9858763.1 hypothetical protein [Breznakia sp. PH5-24]
MEWHELYPPNNEPSIKEISNYINNPLWDTLDVLLVSEKKAKRKIEYSGCSLKGWNIKYKKKGKNLCTIYPYEKYFKLLVVVPEKEKEEADLLIDLCGDNAKEAYKKYDFFNGGKWMIIDIEKEGDVKDALEFIALREI